MYCAEGRGRDEQKGYEQAGNFPSDLYLKWHSCLVNNDINDVYPETKTDYYQSFVLSYFTTVLPM